MPKLAGRWPDRGTLRTAVAVVVAVALVLLIAAVADLRGEVQSLRGSVERQDACIRILERNMRLGPDEPKLSCPMPMDAER